jgi:hypothetical protein
MNTPLLTILIPTVNGREELCQRLLDKIKGYAVWVEAEILERNCKWNCGYMYDGSVGYMICKDDKTMTIGEKRERMYKEATNLYCWQIDDDDDIADNAIELILEAIKQEPDCITFQEYVNIDGREYKSNHSLSYPGWMGDGNQVLSDGFHFWRTPFFKSVIKTEIAKSVPISHIRWGEDNDWADKLKPHLKTEVHIDQQLYLYQHISSNFNERYGYDKQG